MIKKGLKSLVIATLLMTSVQCGDDPMRSARDVMADKMKALEESKAAAVKGVEGSKKLEEDLQNEHETKSLRTGEIDFDENNEFEKAESDALLAHMNPDDMKSFDFIEAFIERSTELTQFSDVQKNDVRLNLLHHEKDFLEARNIVIKPLQMSMELYAQQDKIAMRRRTFELGDAMFAIWRCMNPIHQIFDSFASMMKTSQRITKDQYQFLQISSKPLGALEPDNTNEDIVDIFHEIFGAYQRQDFSKMGYNLADLSWLLRDPEHDHLSDLWELQKVEDVEAKINPQFFDHSKDQKMISKQDEEPQSAQEDQMII